ncbi:MAG: sigma-54-dependent Fis family transcriptional regulator [Blastocatellia bacterium]|nr:sigma-54-dependent Fis family transcriptional regulator [Blastocatellia bacterium]
MKTRPNALVIDDEPQVRSLVADVLKSSGWNVSEADSADAAFRQLNEREWTLVFCDVILGGPNGYEVLRRFADEQQQARFVLMTGHSSAAGALDATAIGAHDYLVKPFSIDDILRIADDVRDQKRSTTKRADLESAQGDDGYVSDIPLIGKSPKFVECLKLVGRVAGTNLTVLIAGESGTGKEVVARAIHQRSKRALGNFVTVNCGAIPVDLIESELFGHSKGSFTGADRERVGLWEESSGGTIFLDEVTETSALFQVKLLRVLQQGEIRRVGSNRTIKVDSRVIAATNRDITAEVEGGRFRQDLMYRLNAVTIHLPRLRERVEDIMLLAQHFAKKARPDNSSAVRFSDTVIQVLESYDWPGNVRELENAILHSVSLADDVVNIEHLPVRIRDYREATEYSAQNAEVDADIPGGSWKSLADVETAYANKVLLHTGGNKQAAARLLNIDRKTLSRIIARTTTED